MILAVSVGYPMNLSSLRRLMLTVDAVICSVSDSVPVVHLIISGMKSHIIPYHDTLEGRWISFVFKSVLGYTIKQL